MHPYLSAYMLLVRTDQDPTLENMRSLLKFTNYEYSEKLLRKFLAKHVDGDLREEIVNSTKVFFE